MEGTQSPQSCFFSYWTRSSDVLVNGQFVRSNIQFHFTLESINHYNHYNPNYRKQSRHARTYIHTYTCTQIEEENATTVDPSTLRTLSFTTVGHNVKTIRNGRTNLDGRNAVLLQRQGTHPNLETDNGQRDERTLRFALLYYTTLHYTRNQSPQRFHQHNHRNRSSSLRTFRRQQQESTKRGWMDVVIHFSVQYIIIIPKE